ncbi:RNA-binding S4 domain-containing protein [Rubrobacter aplysinae]|uniref:RNA-binding S4 domain-containing protein n=1 Tax=Rubrobacter aplysinae TaxID=909625 RepID=UPI000B0C1D54|nr:RNA-binding S4 domain-containing protein [Rubrobacter aplysinae]
MEVSAGMSLGQALKAADLVGSGGEAKLLIQDGAVLVNGEPETRRGRRLRTGDIVEVETYDGLERVEIV